MGNSLHFEVSDFRRVVSEGHPRNRSRSEKAKTGKVIGEIAFAGHSTRKVEKIAFRFGFVLVAELVQNEDFLDYIFPE